MHSFYESPHEDRSTKTSKVFIFSFLLKGPICKILDNLIYNIICMDMLLV